MYIALIVGRKKEHLCDGSGWIDVPSFSHVGQVFLENNKVLNS